MLLIVVEVGFLLVAAMANYGEDFYEAKESWVL